MGNTPIGGAVRAVITVIVGYAAGKGWITESVGAEITAALTTLFVAGWSAFSKSKA